MASKRTLQCAKCGITSKENSSLTFHRFPLPSMHGSLKAKVWAKYCYPDEDISDKLLKRLHTQHKMLCGNHFDNSSFTSSERKRLNNFAIPTEAHNILVELRDEQAPSSASQCILPEIGEEQCHTPTVAQITQASSSKRSGLLKDVEINRYVALSPRKQKLYKRCRRNLSEIIRLRKKVQKVKKSKRSILTSLISSISVDEMLKRNLSSSFYLLLQSQLKNVPRKLTGRRWTLEDKVLALGIYKKSSSCYRLLSRLFCLPSVSSLKKLLNKIPIVCGINEQIMETIREVTANRDVHENICVLAFDEMSIRKNLTYDCKLDKLHGYQDHAGQGRTSSIASHALTFMAIGVRKRWKQPLAFYFSGDSVTADRLSVLLKEVLSACFRVDMEVIGVICDMDRVNVRAINSLGSSRDHPYFEHEGHEIVTIFDPPHLLKCFRNNFLKHDIKFTQDVQIDGQQKHGIAKWSHIEDFYNKDKLNPNFVFAPALTQQHLQPNGKQKMKVRLAAQVLSHSVAAGIFAKVGQNELPQDAVATATIISNLDKLFDSVNGDTPDRKRGKMFLTNMSSTSPHLEFFQKMKSFFLDMKFVGARSKPPSQEGWLRTLNAIERIFNNLSVKYNIKTLSLRRLNQDPLENCFGCIRSNCGCNQNPTACQFVAAFKTSIVTNLINNNKSRNCLDDNNDLLSDLNKFLSRQNMKTSPAPSATTQGAFAEFHIANIEFDELNIAPCSGEMQACAYVCGFIIKKKTINCNECKKVMLADPNTEVCHLFMSFKEYDDIQYSLKYVQNSFCKMVENAAKIINDYLEINSHTEKLTKTLYDIICLNVNKDWLNGCMEHLDSNFNLIINSTIAICLKRFCKIKNNTFILEASKTSLKRKINILKHL